MHSLRHRRWWHDVRRSPNAALDAPITVLQTSPYFSIVLATENPLFAQKAHWAAFIPRATDTGVLSTR